MPFLSLNNSWSNLAPYYNKSFNNKPEVPTLKYTAFDDGLIRGGVINATLSSVRDTARIGKFFASGKGVLFITKQVGLQLSNPLLEQEAPRDTFGKLGDNTRSNLLNKAAGLVNRATSGLNTFINKRSPNQIYNLGLNTLTQIPLVSAGGHIIRQGLLPVGGGGYLNGSIDNIKGYNYLAIAKKHNNSSKQETITSRIPDPSLSLLSLTEYSSTNELAGVGTGYKNAIPTTDKPVQQPGGSIFVDDNGKIKAKTENEVLIKSSAPPRILSYNTSPNRLLQYLKSINTDDSNNKVSDFIDRPITLQNYNGGPGSTYGIGLTTIKTYSDQRTNVSLVEGDSKIDLLNGFIPKPYASLDKISDKVSGDRKNKTYIYPYVNPSSPADRNNNANIETRIGVSKIGGNKNIKKSVDSINVINIIDEKMFYDGLSNNGTLPNTSATIYSNKAIDESLNGKVQGFFGRDIIKFRVEFLNNNTNIPEVLAFRAYINDFNDGMQAKWNSYRYIGRGEDFYIYDGFTRDISVAFTIHAHSPAEMKPLYQKLNYLMSSFAPDYNKANKMRGNIGYLTVGDYLYRQPGVFTDIKLSGMLDTHWEIALNDPEGGSDKNQYEVPKHINVSLSFKPIHNFLPRRSSLGKEGTPLDKTPFITPNTTQVKNKYLYNPSPTS